MLYNLLYPLHTKISALNLFQYITFRATYAFLTALAVGLWLGPRVIGWLGRVQAGQPIRDDGPASHFRKAGTPTMGGLLILLAVVLATLLWADLGNDLVWAALWTLVGFGAIGFYDDWRKVRLRSSRGLPGRWKLVLQLAVASVAAAWLLHRDGAFVDVPVLRIRWEMGEPAYFAFLVFVMVGASNAVNLTDGLDGLAIGPAFMTAAALAVVAYAAGHAIFAEYLRIPYVRGAGELAIFCAAMVGAALAFLWFNAYPAQVFMGDVGALALGGALGFVACAVHQAFLLAIAGGVFVAEALSVITQVVSFKLTGRRVFRMAPIHHHFELKGWPEPKIVTRLWIVSIVLAMVALSTLKIR